MTSRIDISQIKFEQLDAPSLTWLSNFLSALKVQTGKTIALDDHTLRNVVTEAKRTESPELKEIYINFKASMRTHVNSGRFTMNQH